MEYACPGPLRRLTDVAVVSIIARGNAATQTLVGFAPDQRGVSGNIYDDQKIVSTSIWFIFNGFFPFDIEYLPNPIWHHDGTSNQIKIIRQQPPDGGNHRSMGIAVHIIRQKAVKSQLNDACSARRWTEHHHKKHGL